MSEFEKVSVIIPVYNSEKYLEQCIKSVVNQTYKNLEIILVDDGSTDGSAELCDRFSEEDSRVVVIHKSNGGVSSARNCGIARARGKFLVFVDADDYISSDMVEQLVLASKNGAQVVFCRYTEFSDKNDELRVFEENLTKLKESTHDFLPFVSRAHSEQKANKIITDNVFGSVCRTLFFRQIIVENNIIFDEELSITEDLFFLLKYLTFVERSEVIDYYGYYYRKNGGVSDSFVGEKITEEYLKKRYAKFLELSECGGYCAVKDANKVILMDSICVLYPFIMKQLVCDDYRNKLKSLVGDSNISQVIKLWKLKSIKKIANPKLAIIAILIKKRMYRVVRFYALKKQKAT